MTTPSLSSDDWTDSPGSDEYVVDPQTTSDSSPVLYTLLPLLIGS